MKLSKFLYVVLLGLLLVPGNALGEVYLNLIHPSHVVVGDTFTVTVNIVATAVPPQQICSYQYNITYDDSILFMNPNQFQPPVTPAMDGRFFSRVGCDVDPFNCPTAPDLPAAFNCCGTTLPDCPPPARFGFWDASNFFCDDDGLNCSWADPQPVPISLPGRTSATFTFSALAPGCMNFELLSTCPSEVGDCPVEADIEPLSYDVTGIVNNRICVGATPIPALTDFGILLFALAVITLGLYHVRKYSRTNI
jgi:hypothetical protein